VTELNRSVYRTGWHSVWRILRKTLTMIFSVVSYIMKINHVLHPLLPERNDRGYELRRRRHERGLFLRPTMPNAISFTDSYINIGLATNFSTSQLSVVYLRFVNIYNTR